MAAARIDILKIVIIFASQASFRFLFFEPSSVQINTNCLGILKVPLKNQGSAAGLKKPHPEKDQTAKICLQYRYAVISMKSGYVTLKHYIRDTDKTSNF